MPVQFNPDVHVLGSVCKRGHVWPGTDSSLRYRSTRECVECASERRATYGREYYAANQSRLQAKARAYHEANRETCLEKMRAYRETEAFRASQVQHRQRNRDKLNAATRAWKAEHRQAVSDYNRRYSRDNADRMRQRRRAYYAAHRDHIEETGLAYRERHRDLLLARGKAYRQTHNGMLRRRIAQIARIARRRDALLVPYGPHDLSRHFARFGDACAYCGSGGHLTIDHVVPLSKGGSDGLSNIVPACRDCNTRKRTQDAETWFRKQRFFDEKRWGLIVALTRSTSELYFVE